MSPIRIYNRLYPFQNPKKPSLFTKAKNSRPKGRALRPSMSTSAPPDAGDAVPGLSISVPGKLMLAGVVSFFFIFVFLLILFLRANRYSGANPTLASSPALLVFPASGAARATLRRRALDPAVLESLPVAVFNSATFKDGVECAVCLSELADGDATRLLPGCLHGFHLQCIDKWFSSNSTCPICRSSVEPSAVESKNTILGDSKQSSAENDEPFTHEMVMPADGSEEGSSSSVCSVSRKKPCRISAIDTPRASFESSALVLHSSRFLSAVETTKSPNLTRLRSLRRILSMGSRGFSSDCSFRERDIEQGAAPPPETAAGAGSGGEGCSSNRN